MSTSIVTPHAYVPQASVAEEISLAGGQTLSDNQRIRARAMAVIARFEANRELMWKQEGSALAELLQAQILAKAILERLGSLSDL